MEIQLIYENIIQNDQYAKYLLQIYDVDFQLYQSLYFIKVHNHSFYVLMYMMNITIVPLLYNTLNVITEKINGRTVDTELLLELETWFSKKSNRLIYENCFVYKHT